MNIQPMHFPCPDGMHAHDDEFVQRVSVGLQSRLGHEVRNFQLSGREDGLILRGQVNSFYAKQLAQEVVMQTTGLAILANEIVVRRTESPRKTTVFAR